MTILSSRLYAKPYPKFLLGEEVERYPHKGEYAGTITQIVWQMGWNYNLNGGVREGFFQEKELVRVWNLTDEEVERIWHRTFKVSSVKATLGLSGLSVSEELSSIFDKYILGEVDEKYFEIFLKNRLTQ